MWKTLGKYLAKAAVWCVKNPGEIIQIINTAKKVKGSGSGDNK